MVKYVYGWFMFEQGTVKKVKKNIAYVEIKRTAKCDGCKACAFGNSLSIVLPSLMETACGPGDSVVLKMPEGSFAGASLLLFLLPLALFFAGLLSGIALGELYMLLFAFTFAGAGVCLSIVADRLLRFNPKYLPVVTDRILTNEK